MADRDRFELDLAAALRTYLEEAPTEVRPTDLARHFATDYPPGRTSISLQRFAAIPRPACVLLLGAALLAALLGGALLAGSQMQQKLPALVPPVVPPKETPSSTPAMTGPAGTWNPILATTRAKPAPTAATCPPDTDPDTPGPADRTAPRLAGRETWPQPSTGTQAGSSTSTPSAKPGPSTSVPTPGIA